MCAKRKLKHLMFRTSAGAAGVPGNSTPVGGSTGATLRIEQTLLRAVPQRVTHQRFSGLNSSELLLFGPELREKAAVIQFTGVDPRVTFLQIDYLANGVLVGTGRIPVTLAEGSVTVVQDPPFTDVLPTIRSIEVTPSNGSVPVGFAQQLTATATLSDSTRRDVTGEVDWSTTPPGVATIEGSRARGLTLGQVTIEASLNGISATANLNVTAAVPTALSVEPPEAISATGSRRQYRAVATFSDQSIRDVTEEVEWTENYDQTSFEPDKPGLLQIAPQAESGQGLTVQATLASQTATADLSLASYLYTVHAAADRVLVFSRDALSGSLTQQSFLQFGNIDPTDIVIHPTGRFAFVVNTADNSVTPFAIDPTTGGLAQGTTVSTGQAPTAIVVDPGGKLAAVVNETGDSITTFLIDNQDGSLTLHETKSVGDEPWSLDFDSTGRFLYVLNRLSDNISSFSYDPESGDLTSLETVENVATNGTELSADPVAPFLYVANYSVDGLNAKVFSIDTLTGMLAPAATANSGNGPWTVRVHPLLDFAYFTNLSGNSLSTFAIGRATAKLEKQDEVSVGDTGAASNLRIDPTGDFLFVVHTTRGVLRFDIDPVTGLLSNEIAYSTSPHGSPRGLAVLP